MGQSKEDEALYKHPVIVGLAKDYNRTPAQICLKWALQRGCAVLPKSCNPERIAENLNVFGFEMSRRDMERITFLNKNRRFNDPGHWWEVSNNTFFPVFD